MNHNPTKILQIENQIRLYEQQINDTKRRIETIEVEERKSHSFQNRFLKIPLDSSSMVKTSLSDENLVHRPTNSFLESSNNRTSMVSVKRRKTTKNEDEENTYILAKQVD